MKRVVYSPPASALPEVVYHSPDNLSCQRERVLRHFTENDRVDVSQICKGADSDKNHQIKWNLGSQELLEPCL